MTALKSLMNSTLVVVFAFFLAINYSGCTKQSPLSPTLSSADDATGEIAGGGGQGEAKGDPKAIGLETGPNSTEITWPLSQKKAYGWNKDKHYYNGGTLKARNGAMFHVFDGSLVPPDKWPQHKDVEIEMTIDYHKNNGELLYTFGPSGCTFGPAAEIWLDYNILECDDVALYLVQGNDYFLVDEARYENDRVNHRIRVKVPHFSRYSLIRR